MTTRPPLSKPARWAAVFCIIAFLATMWPIYPLFSRVFPLVLGMPFSLFYLVTILVTVFFVMLGLYLWESANGELD
ncbi:MAG TPA: hypothetical protein VLK65_29640 [Vicinamibacteria bacterium]|nr:hypothetical protein [Vicinamibacteria bacterium]